MNEIELTIENVGGIDHLETSFESGISLVKGENASNKTSLLQAIVFAMGAETVPIRTDADRARVELTVDGTTVTRTATRDGRTTSISGTPWIEDDDRALLFERFGGLLGTNPLRSAVESNADIEQLLKEPMNIEELERTRAQLLDRKREIRQEIDSMEEAEDDLEGKRDLLSERREERERLEAQLAEYDEEFFENEELSSLREERAELVSERDRLEEQVESTETAVERLESRLDDLREELEDARGTVEGTTLPELRSERDELRESVGEIEDRVAVLQSALTANREMLETDVRDLLEYDAAIDEDRVECWACGDQRPASAFEDTVDRLEGLVEAEKERRAEYEPRIRDLETRIEEAETAKRELERLEVDVEGTESKLAARRESLSEKRNQLAEVTTEIESLDDEIAATRNQQAEEQSERSEEIQELRVELEGKSREIERLQREITDLQSEIQRRRKLQSELDEVTAEIRELTDRIENLEGELRETFNDAMDELIEALEFDRIERAWLDGEFDLVIAREIDGQVREDGPESLAESEREVIGLVLGLAGYMAYDVFEFAPVLVLDSMGAFDADRTRRVVDYFGEYTDHLVVALHPEQATDLDRKYDTVEPDAMA